VAVLIVDGANVVGSVPNGWWRDRLGAARRLRDAIAPLASEYDEVILVVEGQARDLESAPEVRVVKAPGEGDDTIVEVVREFGPDAVVVTADRGLRDRVEPLGATVIGPRSLAYS
jgi:nucleotide-binding universal stress UspA family protein